MAAIKNFSPTSSEIKFVKGRDASVGTTFVVQYAGGTVATGDTSIFIELKFTDNSTPVIISQKFDLGGTDLTDQDFTFEGTYFTDETQQELQPIFANESAVIYYTPVPAPPSV